MVRVGVVTAVDIFVVAYVEVELLVAASVTVIGLLVVPWVAAVELLVVRLLAGRGGVASLYRGARIFPRFW